MSKSKKSVIIIISAICAVLIIALGICVGQFYSSTTASIEEYCKENSFKGAESFDWLAVADRFTCSPDSFSRMRVKHMGYLLAFSGGVWYNKWQKG